MRREFALLVKVCTWGRFVLRHGCQWFVNLPLSLALRPRDS